MEEERLNKLEARIDEALRNDGWMNLFAGMGTRRDKSTYTTTGRYRILRERELTDLWMGDGLGKKIVSCVADDMTRKWISTSGDPDNKIQAEFRRLKVKKVFNEALKWNRLYGGAVILVGYRGPSPGSNGCPEDNSKVVWSAGD